MHKKILFTLFLLWGAFVQAQDSTRIYKNLISINPLKLLHPVYSGIEVSYQRNHSAKYSSQLSAAYIYKLGSSSTATGFRLQFEEKCVLAAKSKKREGYSSYLAFNASYSRLDDSFSFLSFDGSQFHSRTIAVVKEPVSVNIKLGVEIIVKHVVFDLYMGGGPKLLINSTNEAYELTYNGYDIFSGLEINNRPGIYWYPNILLGFKVGYLF